MRLRLNGSTRCGRRKKSLGALRSGLEIALQQLDGHRTGEAEAQEAIQRTLLDVGAGLPTRDGRFANPEQAREFLLRSPKLLAARANLLRCQQLGLAAKGSADVLVGLVVDAERARQWAHCGTTRSGISTR